jgi:hypothetical protein
MNWRHPTRTRRTSPQFECNRLMSLTVARISPEFAHVAARHSFQNQQETFCHSHIDRSWNRGGACLPFRMGSFRTFEFLGGSFWDERRRRPRRVHKGGMGTAGTSWLLGRRLCHDLLFGINETCWEATMSCAADVVAAHCHFAFVPQADVAHRNNCGSGAHLR